jgi:hypothetical protein
LAVVQELRQFFQFQVIQTDCFSYQIGLQEIPDQLILVGVRPKIVRGVKASPNGKVFPLGWLIIIFGASPVASLAPPGLKIQTKTQMKNHHRPD